MKVKSKRALPSAFTFPHETQRRACTPSATREEALFRYSPLLPFTVLSSSAIYSETFTHLATKTPITSANTQHSTTLP